MRKVRIGIIGAGKVAPFHTAVFKDLENAEIIAISNRTREKAEKIANDYGIKRVYDNYNEMIFEEELDAVCICTSVNTIYQISLDCINAGLNCLIEKPPGINLEQAKNLKKSADEKNVKVMVALNRRFVSTIQRANEMIKGDQLKTIIIEAPERFEGALKRVEKFSPEVLDAWIFANGIHCLDLFTYFAGEAEKIVNASDKEGKSYNALIKFSNSTLGHYYSNWDSPGNWGVTLITDKKKIILLPLEQGNLIDSNGNNEEFGLLDIDQKYKPGFYLQNKYFVDAIKKGEKISYPACSISEALKTMQLIDKIGN